ncbi:hypothetical protein [Solimonas soli]|uniref:hypothetical protein n=1 Tax=Solimonas soli TaxID=413479 RepID=UPI0004849241|nr:hypothetical protein [Solimonas soli]
MREDEVPQDEVAYYGGARKALYAVDRQGHYETVASSGWAVEATVTGDAIAEFERRAAAARVRVARGESSPLEFHMYARRMDLPTLAQSTGFWRCSVRRDLRPDAFARLRPARLRRYADALGIGVEVLQTPPPEAPPGSP